MIDKNNSNKHWQTWETEYVSLIDSAVMVITLFSDHSTQQIKN